MTKTLIQIPCGYEIPPETIKYEHEVRRYYNITSQTYTDEDGHECLWHFADIECYTPSEYISYLETKLAQERADNDELLIDLDERVTAMEGE